MRLNRKIELFEPTITRGQSGQKERGFTSNGVISCDINNKRGVERYQSFLTVSEHNTLFTIRYNREVSSLWYLVHNGNKYEITMVIEESRLHFMHIIGRWRDNEQSSNS